MSGARRFPAASSLVYMQTRVQEAPGWHAAKQARKVLAQASGAHFLRSRSAALMVSVSPWWILAKVGAPLSSPFTSCSTWWGGACTVKLKIEDVGVYAASDPEHDTTSWSCEDGRRQSAHGRRTDGVVSQCSGRMPC